MKYFRFPLNTGLDERRERKRTRRAIIKRTERPTSDNEEQSDSQDSKKIKAKKAKVPAGYALMHGFSATNVGQHRLTVCLQSYLL
jgi:hypothetical protein